VTDARSRQLPQHLVAREFGEVNVRRAPDGVHVQLVLRPTMEGAKTEGWQTGVALDASYSMRHAYGRGSSGAVPPAVLQDYLRRGMAREVTIDGKKTVKLQPEAHAEATRRGHLRKSPNVIEPLARDFIAMLADRLDEDGGTTVIYWACGEGGEIEVLGDFTAAQCRSLRLNGPARFGRGTQLLPAVRYFVDRFRDANKGIYVFLADGNFADLEEVKRYTTALARAIEQGLRNFVKCVLVGVGPEIDEEQMEVLDDLDTGTGVDIWDHKIAQDMRDLNDIFAELADENMIVAPWAKLHGPNGAVIKKFSTGLPARVTFTLPPGSAWFELELGDRRIRQTVSG
jgi:hypothetical protein